MNLYPAFKTKTVRQFKLFTDIKVGFIFQTLNWRDIKLQFSFLPLACTFIFIIARSADISPEKQMELSCHLETCFGSHSFLPLTRLHTSRCHKSCIQGKVFAFTLYCQATLETQCFKIHFNQSSSSLHKRVNKYLSVLCWNVKHDPLEVLTTYCLCQNLCHWKLLHDSSTSTHCIGRV